MGAQIFALDSEGRWVRPKDAITGHRTESYRIDLLNQDDVMVAKLLGVTGGQFTFNVNAPIRGGGSIDYLGEKIDWNTHRIQPWYQTSAGDEFQEWPLGVFLVATPDTEYSDTGRAVTLEMYDKTQILNDDQLPSTYQVAAGTNIITAVRTVLAEAGQTRTAIEDTDQVLANGMVWPAGSSRLRIINDLLQAANYFSIWADGDGVFRTGPYLAPSNRGISWAFQDDERSIYSPDFSHNFDTFNVPNRVVVIGQSDGEEEAPVAVVEDTSGGPFSYQTRGRWITRTEEGQEASDQAGLEAIAHRFLQEGQQVGSTFQIKHAPIPLELHSAVAFRRGTEGIDIQATVQTISYSMDVGALCSTTLREYTP